MIEIQRTTQEHTPIRHLDCIVRRICYARAVVGIFIGVDEDGRNESFSITWHTSCNSSAQFCVREMNKVTLKYGTEREWCGIEVVDEVVLPAVNKIPAIRHAFSSYELDNGAYGNSRSEESR